MEACMSVGKEIDRLLKSFKDINKNSDNGVQELVDIAESVHQNLSDVGGECQLDEARKQQLEVALESIHNGLQKLSNSHKDLHSNVSRVGRTIDKNFVADLCTVIAETSCLDADEMNDLNHVICEHFLRQGMLEIADNLLQEASLNMDPGQKEPFIEMFRILEALQKHDLQPALTWTQTNREKLEAINSSLEFKLHRLQFLELIQRGPDHIRETLQYTRNFAPFAYTHTQEVQRLMGCLLFAQHGLDKSPYASIMSPVEWLEICGTFTRDVCSLLGLSVDSPLSVAISAGCSALPPLVNIRQVMLQRQCEGVWNVKDELPVEIDLGDKYKFHSIFACPILRQQSVESNPPMRLVCGHVISKNALGKLANGSNRVKCPYCPVEQQTMDAKQIYF